MKTKQQVADPDPLFHSVHFIMEPITDMELLAKLISICRLSISHGHTEAGAIEACDRITRLSYDAILSFVPRISEELSQSANELHESARDLIAQLQYR